MGNNESINMDKAKQAVSGFLSKHGQHDTTIHESVDPSVEKKTIAPMQREERQIATDREVHQDHYHTTVQPVHDKEVLPEQHHHTAIPVEHRTHDKRDNDDDNSKLHMAKAQFQNEEVRQETQHSSTTMPTVGGEHTHHHIHETIQPVVHKESGHPSMVDERVDRRRASSSSSDEEKRKNKDKNYGEFSHRSDGNHPSGVSQQTSREKPSMMDKLNPKKDADRDGKAGFMS